MADCLWGQYGGGTLRYVPKIRTASLRLYNKRQMQIDEWQISRQANYNMLLPKCQLPKCPLPKCLDTIPLRVNRIYGIVDTAPLIGATAISQGAMSPVAGCTKPWLLVESINIHRRLCSDRS